MEKTAVIHSFIQMIKETTAARAVCVCVSEVHGGLLNEVTGE